MLFDSNVNVYEDSNVVLQEFDFRTRAPKIDYKSKKKGLDRARIAEIKKKREQQLYQNL